MDHSLIYIVGACLIGFIMSWGVGANDLANVMSTTMGSKAVTVRQAMLIAIIFELAGAILGSSDVSNTLRNGIINTAVFANTPIILIYGMLSVLLAGTTWMLFASYFGLPVSITNAIVGSLVGFGSVVLGIHAIHWDQVRWIAISWVLSPLLAGITAYLLFRSIQRLILIRIDPVRQAQRYLPLYLFAVGVVLSYMTVLKGIKHAKIILTSWENFLVVIVTSIVVVIAGMFLSKRIDVNSIITSRDKFAAVEKIFSLLMAFTACAMVFAHGSNDVAVAVGPMAAVVNLVNNHGQLSLPTPLWIVLVGVFGVLLGLFMYGRKVIETVGNSITALTPSRAFAATLAAATVIIVSTSSGIPVSATQTLVGGVLGVGFARGIGALNLNIVRNILLSWLITIPAASLLAIAYFYLFKLI